MLPLRLGRGEALDRHGALTRIVPPTAPSSFGGRPGHEHLVHIVASGGEILRFKGRRGRERVVHQRV